jgi:uncharacterized protein YbcI
LPPPERLSAGQLKAAIANAAVKIAHDYTGRGANRAQAEVNRDVIVVLMEDALTKADLRLASAGEEDTVLHMRRLYQKAMRQDLVNAIEELTERKVVAFMSDNHIEPDMAVEIFVLEAEG